jgi:hypothetical protein
LPSTPTPRQTDGGGDHSSCPPARCERAERGTLASRTYGVNPFASFSKAGVDSLLERRRHAREGPTPLHDRDPVRSFVQCLIVRTRRLSLFAGKDQTPSRIGALRAQFSHHTHGGAALTTSGQCAVGDRGGDHGRERQSRCSRCRRISLYRVNPPLDRSAAHEYP